MFMVTATRRIYKSGQQTYISNVLTSFTVGILGYLLISKLFSNKCKNNLEQK